MMKLKGFKLLNLDNLQVKFEKKKSVRVFQVKLIMNHFSGVILFIPVFFTNIFGKIKLVTFSFLLKGLSS